MTEDCDTHVCRICGHTVRNEFDPRPMYADKSGFDIAYVKCPHCWKWHHVDSDCCPYCNCPYCGE